MRIPIYLLTLVIPVFLVSGCDSDEDDEASDAETMVGTWAVENLADDEGDKTAVFFAEAEGAVVNLRADDTFSLTMDYNAAGEAAGYNDVTLAGTYSVNESAGTLSLTVTVLGATLPASYTIVSQDRIRLSAPAVLINPLFGGTPNVGTVVITLERQ